MCPADEPVQVLDSVLRKLIRLGQSQIGAGGAIQGAEARDFLRGRDMRDVGDDRVSGGLDERSGSTSRPDDLRLGRLPAGLQFVAEALQLLPVAAAAFEKVDDFHFRGADIPVCHSFRMAGKNACPTC